MLQRLFFLLFYFGNPVIEVPVGLPVVAQTEGGGFQMEGGVTAGAILVMEDWWENVTSNVPTPTCSSSINAFGVLGGGVGSCTQPEKNNTFYSEGALERGGKKQVSPSPPSLLAVWRATPVSIRLKGVLLMLHLSLPIVNSVAPFPPWVKMAQFVYLPVSLFCAHLPAT